MSKRGIQENKFTFNKDRTGHKTCMPIIKCLCGSKILVVPDLKAMGRAIKNHVAEHKRANSGLAFDSLEDFLVKQILLAASKVNLLNVS